MYAADAAGGPGGVEMIHASEDGESAVKHKVLDHEQLALHVPRTGNSPQWHPSHHVDSDTHRHVRIEVFYCPSTTSLQNIRRSVSNDVMETLIVTLVFSRLDYGSATLADLSRQFINRLQSVQNAATRLIFRACRQDHIQPLLRRLHWLRMPERVSFPLAVLVYRGLHGSALGYLASDLHRVSHLNASRRALFDYVSAGRSTQCAFYHWRPHLSSDCWIGLEQFAGVSPVIAVAATSFPQQTENWTFCPVLQSWLTTSHCTDYYYVTSLFRLIVSLRVLVVLGLNATLKFIRSSSSSSLIYRYSSNIWQKNIYSKYIHTYRTKIF